MKARDGKKKNFYYFLLLHFWQQYKFLVEMISIFLNATFDRYRYFVSLPTACTSTHVSHFTILWQQSCRDSYNTIISPSLLLILRGNNYFLLVIIPFLLSVLLVILLYFWQLWPAFCAAPISEPDSTPTEQPPHIAIDIPAYQYTGQENHHKKPTPVTRWPWKQQLKKQLCLALVHLIS